MDEPIGYLPVLDVTVLLPREASSEEAAAYALRLADMDQLIINGESRIGRLGFLVAIMGEYKQSTSEAEALIRLYEGRLHDWNENRFRMMARYEPYP